MRRIGHFLLSKFGLLVRRALKYSDTRPYQSLLLGGGYVEGKVDAVAIYYSFALPADLTGSTWLDLGCNEGSTILLAAQHGASATGIEYNSAVVTSARRLASAQNLDVSIQEEDVIDFIKASESYDIVSLLAMIRHVHSGFMKRGGYPMAKTGRPYLLYNAYQTIVEGIGSPVRSEVDAFVKTCMDKTRRYFLFSVHDHSGLFFRRQEEVKAYFRRLSDRISTIEIYSAPRNSEYTVVRIEF